MSANLSAFAGSAGTLDREGKVIKMTRALGRVSKEWLGFAVFRCLAYVCDGIGEDDIAAFDDEAYRRELTRRRIFGEDSP